MADNIQYIHANKLAKYLKQYIGKDGTVYIGQKDGRLSKKKLDKQDVNNFINTALANQSGSALKKYSGLFTLEFGERGDTSSADIAIPDISTSIYNVSLQCISRVEDFMVEGIQMNVVNPIAGKFTVTGYAPLNTNGSYQINYTVII